MKRGYCLAPALAFALMVPPAIAVAQTPAAQQPQPQQPTPEQQEPRKDQARVDPAQPEIIRADRIIGQAVRDRQDQRLGRINDLALNLKEGKIEYALVTRGGVWGIGGEDVAVSWQQIQPDPAAQVVRIDEQQLQQAKRIDTGQPWPMGAGEGPVGTAGTAPQHQVLPMSNIVGMDVHNKQGERLGRIDDVAIARDASLSYAVIAHGGFLGVGDNYVAVPWDRLTLDAQRQAAVLDTTREQLDKARRFEHRERWPARVDWPFGGTR
jgi:sporulation protein YlmC with PRC-barrel domain